MGGAASTEEQEKVFSMKQADIPLAETRKPSRMVLNQMDEARKSFFNETPSSEEWTNRIQKHFGNSSISMEQLQGILREKFSVYIPDAVLIDTYRISEPVTLQQFKDLHAQIRKLPLFSEMFAIATVNKEEWEKFVLHGINTLYQQNVSPQFDEHVAHDLTNAAKNIPKMPTTGSEFVKFLFSEDNDVTRPVKKQKQRMDLPISNYYIRSTGNDFVGCTTGEQVLELFAKRIKQGGRSLYVDCWSPTDVDGDILAFQGCVYDLPPDERKKVTLKKVLDLMAKHSTTKETQTEDGATILLPLFISVSFVCENSHIDEACKTLKEAFGSRISKLPLTSDVDAPLPTLMDLQGAVILMHSPYDFAKQETLNPSVEEIFSFKAADPDSFFEMMEEGQVSIKGADVGHLSALDVCAYTNILGQLSKHRLSQVRFERAAEDEVLTANIAAPGFNPLRAWRYGIHFVPLDDTGENTQSWMQDLLFSQNEGTGFVLKDLEKPKPISDVYILHATVILGKRIPRTTEETTPYLKVSFDSGTGSQQIAISTSQVEDNGMYCVWNETFSFKITSLCQVQTLMFAIRDRDSPNNDDLAWCAVPLSHIRPGTRRLRLKHSNCDSVKGGKLLVNFQFSTMQDM